jgi:hypothetical protein
VSEPLLDFDAVALFEAMDAQRVARGLGWQGVADELWGLSAELNRRRNDHPISPSTLTGMRKRGATSCQHALFVLRWLDRAPESFLTGETRLTPGTTLPPAGPDRRLRWNLRRLSAALEAERDASGLTWAQLAAVLDCTPSQLTGLRTARFATNMNLAMKIVQWLDRPAAGFIDVAGW